MVKTKRDMKSPRRRTSMTLSRPISRTRPTSSVTSAITEANIKVVVRLRPPNDREQDDNSRIVVKQIDNQMLVFDPKEEEQPFFYRGVQQRSRDISKKAHKDLQFMFDNVFGFDVDNEAVFKESTYSLVSCLMDGYNCSVFAYGATGAGKTHTMIGKPECPGITFLTMAELFKKKEELSIERDFELGITYLEVYNELVQDLLNPGAALQLREDGKYGVMVAGIKVYKITDVAELLSLLEQGNKNRTQHPTDANAESSRSHAVFQVYLQMTIRATSEMRTAKLSMIDLAGSERGSATGCTGARFTEGANINKSLLALGNCINSLASGLRHVPYRDSKLTRLLKDSLGGNCRTVMIANVSPSSLSYEDTYNTLKYATRAKKIKSSTKQNVVNVQMHVRQYVMMLEEVKKDNLMLKRQLHEERAKSSGLQKENEELKQNTRATPINANLEVVDTKALELMQKHFEEKRRLIERSYNMDLSGIGMMLRRQLKEETDARLSNLSLDDTSKEEARKRLVNCVQRFQKRELALKSEIDGMQAAKIEVNQKIEELLKEKPQLQLVIDLEHQKLETLEAQYKFDIEHKRSEVFKDSNQNTNDLLEKISRTLKLTFMQLNGHGLATKALHREYEDLVKQYEGRKNIHWGADSGISSTSSLESEEVVKGDGEGNKRTADENVLTTLDSTFLMTPSKKKLKLRAETFVGKALKPTIKRLGGGEDKHSGKVMKTSTKGTGRPPFRF